MCAGVICCRLFGKKGVRGVGEGVRNVRWEGGEEGGREEMSQKSSYKVVLKREGL